MKASLHPTHQTGVSLVEALVALVVISIGMLGIAALHVESLRGGRSAILRSQAVLLAADMAEYIRANRLSNGEYANGAITSADVDSDCVPGGSGCTPTELARHDKATWLLRISTALPGGVGAIVRDQSTNPDTYTISVTWTEQGGSQTYQLRMQG